MPKTNKKIVALLQKRFGYSQEDIRHIELLRLEMYWHLIVTQVGEYLQNKRPDLLREIEEKAVPRDLLREKIEKLSEVGQIYVKIYEETPEIYETVLEELAAANADMFLEIIKRLSEEESYDLAYTFNKELTKTLSQEVVD